MVKEAAGAGSTYGVHSKIGHYSIPDNDKLTILSPNLNDGLHLREIKKGSHSMTGNLIFD